MKRIPIGIFAAISFLVVETHIPVLVSPVQAQAIVLPCVPSGNSCIPVSAANPLPTTGGGGFPPSGCSTSNGVIFNNATPCDSGFTYAGSGGQVSINGAALGSTTGLLVNPASASGLLADFQVGGVSKASISAAGAITGLNFNGLLPSGGFGITLTATGTTNVTLPTTGTLATTSQLLPICTTTPLSIQYNAAGAFGCVSGATSDGTRFTLATFAAGLVSAPTIRFGTDTNTGFYQVSANTISFAASGGKALDYGSTRGATWTVADTGGLAQNGQIGTGSYFVASNSTGLQYNIIMDNTPRIDQGSAGIYGFFSGVRVDNSSRDTSISRKGAGVVQIGTTTANDSGTLDATAYQVGGTAGATCTLTVVAHLTVVNGLVTLCN